MQRIVIIVIISLLTSGTLAGAYYYHESGRKDGVLDKRISEIAALNDRLSKLDEQMKKFQSERQEDRKQLDAIKVENQYIAQLEKNLHEKDKEFVAAQKALEQCDSKRDALLANLQTEQEAVHTLKEKIAGATKKVQAGKDDSALLEENLRAAQTRISNLEDQVLSLQTRKENAQADIDKHISELENSVQQKDDMLGQLRNEVASYKQLEEKWEAQLKTDQENSQSLKDQFSQTTKQLEAEKDVLRKRSDQFDSQIAKLQGQIEEDRISEAQLKNRLSDLQTEKGSLAKSIEELKSTYNALIGDLRENIENREASIRECEDRLSISFVNRLVFGSAMVRISTEGEAILKKAGDILKQYRQGKIRIVGHTDNVPLTPDYRGRYPSNWELSVARAAAVARFFQDTIGIAPERMEIIGRSFHQPIASNDTKEGRSKNRRVEIIVAPTFASAQTIPQ